MSKTKIVDPCIYERQHRFKHKAGNFVDNLIIGLYLIWVGCWLIYVSIVLGQRFGWYALLFLLPPVTVYSIVRAVKWWWWRPCKSTTIVDKPYNDEGRESCVY